MRAYVQLFKKDDATFDSDNLSPENRWSYYISSFTNMEPTEGVPFQRLRPPILERNLASVEVGVEQSQSQSRSKLEAVQSSENLVIRVGVENYRMLFSPKTDEWMVQSDNIRSGGRSGIEEAKTSLEGRNRAAEELLIKNNAWIKETEKEEIATIIHKFEQSFSDGMAKAGQDTQLDVDMREPGDL